MSARTWDGFPLKSIILVFGNEISVFHCVAKSALQVMHRTSISSNDHPSAGPPDANLAELRARPPPRYRQKIQPRPHRHLGICT